MRNITAFFKSIVCMLLRFRAPWYIDSVRNLVVVSECMFQNMDNLMMNWIIEYVPEKIVRLTHGPWMSRIEDAWREWILSEGRTDHQWYRISRIVPERCQDENNTIKSKILSATYVAQDMLCQLHTIALFFCSCTSNGFTTTDQPGIHVIAMVVLKSAQSSPYCEISWHTHIHSIWRWIVGRTW